MKEKIEYAARTAFHEERSANLVPAHIRAAVDRLNGETREDDETPEMNSKGEPILRYRS